MKIKSVFAATVTTVATFYALSTENVKNIFIPDPLETQAPFCVDDTGRYNLQNGPIDSCNGKEIDGFLLSFYDHGQGLPVLTDSEKKSLKAYVNEDPSATFNVTGTGAMCYQNSNVTRWNAYDAGLLRAAVVADFLRGLGLSSDQITTKGIVTTVNCKGNEIVGQRVLVAK